MASAALRRLAERAVRRAAARLGYDTLRSGHYSPVPDLDALPAEVWTRPAPMPGVDLRLDAGLAWLEGELAPLIAEYAPPFVAPGTAHGYHTVNPMYGAFDAEVLYALLRVLRPRRVLELGAGWSSLVVADALAVNAGEGDPAEHVCCDPHPSPLLERVRGTAEVLAAGSRDLAPERYAALGAGDVLFVDTTHAVRPGGDVVHLLLEVLPALAPGVVVHIHDVFRPYEYPRRLLEEFGVVWQEHHLVQALLAGGERFEVLLANHALLRAHPDRIHALVPSLTGAEEPCALWLRVR